MATGVPQIRTPEAEADRFKMLSERYTALLATEGISRKPYRDPSVPLFRMADFETRSRAIGFLEMSNAVFEGMLSDGQRLRDSHQLIWRVLGQLRVTPNSGVFDHVRDDLVVEVFNIAPSFHIAWNLRLMELVSVTIEQLLTLPLDVLCERPPHINEMVGKLFEKIARGEQQETLIRSIPYHIVKEKDSDDLVSLHFEVVAISPLRRAGRVIGLLSVSESSVLETRSTARS